MKYIAILHLLFCAASASSQTAEGMQVLHFDKTYEKIYFENYRVEYEFHLANIQNSPKIKNLIKKLVYGGKDFAPYIEQKEKAFIGNLTAKDFPALQNADGTPYQYHSTYTENYEITGINQKYVTVKYTEYFYISRSAHGMTSQKYVIIDLASKKVLSLNDLLTALPEKELAQYITQKYPTLPASFRGSLWPPNTLNFEVKGITLLWDLYSIAPYSFGLIEITLPYDKAAPYLTQKGRTLRENFLVE